MVKDDDDNWTKPAIKQLVLLYQSYPCLWNFGIEEYHLRDMKKAAWNNISTELEKMLPSITIDECKTKINKLRTAYNNELRKVTASLKSGAKIEDVYTPKLWYFNMLKFVTDGCPRRESTSSMAKKNITKRVHAQRNTTNTNSEETSEKDCTRFNSELATAPQNSTPDELSIELTQSQDEYLQTQCNLGSDVVEEVIVEEARECNVFQTLLEQVNSTQSEPLDQASTSNSARIKSSDHIPPKRAKKHKTSDVPSINVEEQFLEKCSQLLNQETEDADVIFCKSIAASLQKLPNNKAKLLLKKSISDLVFDAELKLVDSGD